MFTPIGIGVLQEGGEIELDSKYSKDRWGFIANRMMASVNGKIPKADSRVGGVLIN